MWLVALSKCPSQVEHLQAMQLIPEGNKKDFSKNQLKFSQNIKVTLFKFEIYLSIKINALKMSRYNGEHDANQFLMITLMATAFYDFNCKKTDF